MSAPNWRRRATRRLRSWQKETTESPLFKYTPGDSLTALTGPAGRLYLDANGVWQTVSGANVARDGHYIGGVRHLLLETQRQNVAPGACSFANDTYWTGSASFTLATATSCIAGQTAYKHTNKNQGANACRIQDVGTFVNGQTDCFVVVVENDATVPAATTRLAIYDNTAAAFVHRADFTWATHAIADISGTGAKGVTDLGNGRYLIWITATGAASGTGGNGNTRRLYIYPTGALQNDKACIVHYAGLSPAAAFPESPIVTVASPVTRSAEAWDLSAYTWASQETTRYWKYWNLATAAYVEEVDVATRTAPDDFTNAAQLDRAYVSLKYAKGSKTLAEMAAL